MNYHGAELGGSKFLQSLLSLRVILSLASDREAVMCHKLFTGNDTSYSLRGRKGIRKGALRRRLRTPLTFLS